GCEVKSATRCHADGGDNKNRGGAGEACGQPTSVNNGPCADETDAGNDLGRDAGRVGGYACQSRGEQSEHGCAKADEHVGAKSSRTVVQLTLKTDRTTQDCGQQKSRHGTGDDAACGFLVDEIEEAMPVHGGSVCTTCIGWPDFNIPPRLRCVTGMITAGGREWPVTVQ